MPSEEIARIDNIIFQKSWGKLQSDEIKLIRESLGFLTKSKASRFLGLNEKAFVKLEQGSYSDLNYSTDLLLRLSVFSRQNFNFIKNLHEKNFKFEPNDYEMICKNASDWNYSHISRSSHSEKFSVLSAVVYQGTISSILDTDDGKQNMSLVNNGTYAREEKVEYGTPN